MADWQWHPFEAKGSRGGNPGSKGYGQAYAPYKKIENPDHTIQEHNDISIGLQDLSSGGDFATAWLEKRLDNQKSNLLIKIQSSYPDKTSLEDAIKVIEDVQLKIVASLHQWRKEHQSWWHGYYPESYVSIPEPEGQSFYWNNVYRLAC